MNIKKTRVYILLRSVYVRLFRKQPKDYYISKVSRKSPWVYIAYIADVFYHLHDEEYLSSHQNKREAVAMVEVFNEMGYNVYVQDYLSKKRIPKVRPQIVIGLEPNMVRASLLYPKAWKIYYATGSYGGHQNHQIKQMTDYVNQKYGSQIPYRRLVDDSIFEAYKIADDILMIGSKYTQDTFPKDLRGKITRIHQSSQLSQAEIHIECSTENEFFFLGSVGNLLKGIPLLIEYFSEHTDYILNVVGPIEEDVKNTFRHVITNNIKFHGWVSVNSEKMAEIVSRCNFIIYPSGSEGMPGAVLNAMKLGLIPIVTKWSAFDEIEDYGYVLENWDIESIQKGILWAQSMSRDEMLLYKRNCAQYVNKTYNLERYKKELITFLGKQPE